MKARRNKQHHKHRIPEWSVRAFRDLSRFALWVGPLLLIGGCQSPLPQDSSSVKARPVMQKSKKRHQISKTKPPQQNPPVPRPKHLTQARALTCKFPSWVRTYFKRPPDNPRSFRQDYFPTLREAHDKSRLVGPVHRTALKACLSAADWRKRWLAAGFFGGCFRFQQKKSIATLLGLLRDPDWRVRRIAIWGLGQWGNKAKSAVPSLLSLGNASDWRLRRFAFWSLHRITPNNRQFQILLKKAQKDSLLPVRQMASWIDATRPVATTTTGNSRKQPTRKQRRSRHTRTLSTRVSPLPGHTKWNRNQAEAYVLRLLKRMKRSGIGNFPDLAPHMQRLLTSFPPTTPKESLLWLRVFMYLGVRMPETRLAILGALIKSAPAARGLFPEWLRLKRALVYHHVIPGGEERFAKQVALYVPTMRLWVKLVTKQRPHLLAMLFAKEHIYQNIAISLLGQLRPDAALGLPALSRLKRQLSSPPRSLSGARSSKQKDHKQLSALLRTIRNITHGRNLAVLARILRSKQHIHRLFAARQLGHLPTQQKQAIGLLLQHLKREHQIAVKLTLIGSLAKLPITKSEQNAVLRRLNGMNEGVEKRALKSLLRPAKPEPLLLHLPRLRQRRSGLKHSTRNTRRQPGQGSLLQVLRKLRLRHEFRKSRRHRLFPPRTSFRQQVLRGHAALLALKKQGALTPQAKAAFTRLAREIIFAPPDPKPCSWGGGLNASPRLSFIENLQMDLLYEEFVRQLLQHH